MSGITINIAQGGLGRRLPGEDYISGLVMPIVNADLPAGFGASDRIKKVSSLDDAVALGITEDGTALNAILYYHVFEFFRIYSNQTQATGELWIHLTDSTDSFTPAHVTDLQTAAAGKVRQFGVYTNTVYAAGLVTTAATAATQLLGAQTPAVILLTADISALATVGDLPDARALNSDYVSLDVGQDGSGRGKALFDSEGQTIGSLGALLGVTASSSVSDNIGHVARFDISDAAEYQTPVLGNDLAVANLSLSDFNTLITNGLLFVRQYVGAPGAYFADSPQAVAANSDFAYIENSRTIQKVFRQCLGALTPFINAPLVVDATSGLLSENTIFELESAVRGSLEDMATRLEIAVDQQTQKLPANSVFIDPDQNVLSTSQVNITLRVVPIGVQRETILNIGFTPKIA